MGTDVTGTSRQEICQATRMSEDILVASILDPTIYKLKVVKNYFKEEDIDPADLIRKHYSAHKDQEHSIGVASSSSQASSSLASRSLNLNNSLLFG
ncbi:hypothetical protein DMENIID0001_041470 [Sergentomyia squamirostris]